MAFNVRSILSPVDFGAGLAPAFSTFHVRRRSSVPSRKSRTISEPSSRTDACNVPDGLAVTLSLPSGIGSRPAIRWFDTAQLSRLAEAHRSGRADNSRLLWKLLMLDRSLVRLGVIT